MAADLDHFCRRCARLVEGARQVLQQERSWGREEQRELAGDACRANGSGKSLVLSTILDAIVTMRSKGLGYAPEADEGKLFKPMKQSVRSFGTADYAAAICDFTSTDGDLGFIELVVLPDEHGICKVPEGIAVPSGFNAEQGNFLKSGFAKYISRPNEVCRKTTDSAVLAYFPTGRAERPSWLSETSPVNFDLKTKYVEIAKYSTWRSNLVEETTRYVLDVILDMELYNYKIVDVLGFGALKMPVDGNNRKIFNHLNFILKKIDSSPVERSERL